MEQKNETRNSTFHPPTLDTTVGSQSKSAKDSSFGGLQFYRRGEGYHDRESVKPHFSKLAISKIHWKSQFLSNIFFGLPVTIFAAAFLGLTSLELKYLALSYFCVYFFFYIPYWAVLPNLFARGIGRTMWKLDKEEFVDSNEIKRTLVNLLKYPLKVSAVIFISIISGWLVIIQLGLIGKIVTSVPIRVISGVAVGVGFVVSSTGAFLNYTLLESHFRPYVENLVSRLPLTFDRKLPMRRIPLFSKILLMGLVITIAVQVSLAIVFLGKLALIIPDELPVKLPFALIVWLLSLAYVFIITLIFSRNVTNPLKKLITWSRRITAGDLEAKIFTLTNDEVSEVIANSTQMVNELDRERKVITVEKNKLDVVLSGIDDGVIALNQDHRIVIYNKAAEEMVGLSAEQAIKEKVDQVLEIYDEGEHRLTSKEFCCSLDDDERQVGVFSGTNLKLINRRREEKYISLMVICIETGAVADVNFLITLNDITEERELERMKLDFVAMAAHELRTPITSIMGYLSVLKDEIGPSLQPEYQQFISRSLTSTKRLTALMENMLSITRIERGRLSIRKKDVIWEELVRRSIEDFEPAARDKGVGLEWIPPKWPLPRVMADPLRIPEILNNLLNNAVTYTQKGKVSVWCEYDRNKKAVVTHIRDTGPGIPKESIPHLFTKFYRVMGPLEEGSKGTGLGLYISKSIVEMHGGVIWAESELGVGSTFSFSLPAVVPESRMQGIEQEIELSMEQLS